MNFKSLMKKVSIVLVFLVLFNFCFSCSVNAAWGGKLAEPVGDLLLLIGDGIYDVLHKVCYGTSFGSTMVSIQLGESLGKTFLESWAMGVLYPGVGSIVGMIRLGGAIANRFKAEFKTEIVTTEIDGEVVTLNMYSKDNYGKTQKIVFPVYSISPEEIFSNLIPILDVNFFQTATNDEEQNGVEVKDTQGNVLTDKDGNPIKVKSSALTLRSTISNWYKNLRNIAVVLMLSILVYIGIRILLSSVANDKAKYKQMLMDWVIAICLLFTMHYIMSFSNIIVKEFTDLIRGSTVGGKNKWNAVVFEMDDDKMMEQQLEKYGLKLDEIKANINGKDCILWKTNFAGVARIKAQMDRDGSATYFGYIIMFLVMVAFTIIFMFTYLKRVIYMAFLTLIAPLVAMTYPIDKINDGKAQAFDMWFKEYIFNLLIQPMHLLLYTILVTSAFELASQNMLYSLVALAFMVPAEQLLRKFFGFEKAKTPGMLAGPAGAAMMMSGMNKLLGLGPKGPKRRDGSDSKGEKESTKIKQNNKFDTEEAFTEKNNNSGLPSGNNGSTQGQVNQDDGTDQQKMVDADYENNWPDADDDDRQFMDANARDAYGINGQNGISNGWDDPNLDVFREQGYSDEELQEMFDLPDKNNQTSQQSNVQQGIAYADYQDGGIGQIQDQTQTQAQSQNYNNIQMARFNNQGTNRSNNSSNSKSNNNKKIKKPRGIRNGMKNIGKFYGKKIKNLNPVRKGIRMVGGTFVGATAASIGLAAGIASGDSSKAFQYSIGGAVGGYRAGTGIANQAMKDPLKVKEASEEFKKGYYGKDQYKQIQTNKKIKEIQKNSELKNLLEDELGKEKASQYMYTAVPDLIQNKIEDHKAIVTIAKMEDKGWDRKKAMSASLLNDRYLKDKDSNHLGAKDEENFMKTLKNNGVKRGLKGKDLDTLVERQREAVDEYNRLLND